MISILILTFNEEKNIKDCLDSVSWSKDVLVFDSYSEDSTLQIAKKSGARVIQRRFDNYGSQRQAALEKGKFKYPWILVLDADERVDEELAVELKAIAYDKSVLHDGFRIRRMDHFLGHWIPRSTLYPTWHLRFFKGIGARYEKRTVHEHPVLTGSIGELKGHLHHFSFNKGLDEWLAKHKKYAKLEAAEGLALARQPIDWVDFFSPDPGRRRRSLKAFSYRWPCRGVFRFLYMMMVRMAFLDGPAGIRYSWMISRYESWVNQEMIILRKAGQ